MKRLTTLLASIISLTAFGQDTLKTKGATEFKRMMFGVNSSPDYCYRTLKNNGGNAMASTVFDIRNSSEEYKIGYTAGLNACYNFSERFGIELGVQYSNKGYTYKMSDLSFGDLIGSGNGIVYSTPTGQVPVEAKYRYNFIYLDVPARAIFYLGTKKVRFVASVGVTTNILLKATLTSVSEYEDGNTKRETYDQEYDFKSLNVSPTISAGLDYSINNKLNLRAEPTFRYGLIEIIDAPITAYLWNAGMNITCYYALK